MALANGNIIDLIGSIVASLRDSGTIVSENVVGGKLVVEVSSLFNLAVNEYVTIGGTDYKIFAIDSGTPSFTIDISSPTGETTFTTGAPYYFNGTLQMINSEQGEEPDFFHRYPAIYLFDIFRQTLELDPINAIARTPRLSIAFMKYSEADYSSAQQNPIIDEMQELRDAFLVALEASAFVGRLGIAETFRHPNFGVFAPTKGNTRQLMNDQVSGVTLEIDVPIKRNFDGCKNITLNFCAPSLVLDSSGNLITSLASGASYTEALNTVFFYNTDSVEVVEITATAAFVGVYQTEVLDNVATIVYEINAVVVVLPFEVELNDVLKATITRTAGGVSTATIST